MIRLPRHLAFAPLAALLCFGTAAAQPIDLSKGGPIEVTARGGFEWRENQQMVIATDEARAVRGDVVVTADRLTAFYRKKAETTATPAAAQASTSAAPAGSATDTGGNEVYRLEAEGHVLITTPTDQAQGDHAVYDIDQAVLVLTGHDLKLTTPQEVMTARDDMEYWSQKHMAVGRGNAVVVTTDGRRIAADVLVGYTSDNTAAPQPASAPTTVSATPVDPLASSGKLERVEAFGNVEVRTATDIARGDRGVYVTDTGMARIVGHVRITHGENQSNGPAADVNMKTGIAHLVSDPSERVNGLIMPNDAQAATGPGAATKPGGKKP